MGVDNRWNQGGTCDERQHKPFLERNLRLVVQRKQNSIFAWMDHKFPESIGEGMAMIVACKMEEPNQRFRLVRTTLEVLSER